MPLRAERKSTLIHVAIVEDDDNYAETIQEYLKNIGCTDIPKGIRKLRKQTNKINRKYCRDKLEREGLWMRLAKDKKNTPATCATESLTGILKNNKAKLEDLRERYGPIDG